MCNLGDCVNKSEVNRKDFWLAILLPRDSTSNAVMWKTKKALPPDVSAGSFCCKIQWLERKDIRRYPRKFTDASMQYLELNCIVPLNFTITFDRVLNNCRWLSDRVEKQLLDAVSSCVVVGNIE